ncbi:MAG: type II toxin-antitoxin system PemK/MazF family toxin [Spirochaetota bacterium]|nr:type II toxin-antitoxin system PemK/MazF family toxin [Spirochaetota bacterium]
MRKKIVIFPFPCTDFSDSKKRPCLVLKDYGREDLLLALITTRKRKDEYSVDFSDNNLESGRIFHESVIRTNRLFTGSKNYITKEIAVLSNEKFEEVINLIHKTII